MAPETNTSAVWEQSSLMVLRPTTSSLSRRYDRNNAVQLTPKVIHPGLYIVHEPEPQYLPSHWTAYTHPEGQLYFYKDSTPRIVTEAYIYNPLVLERISRAEKHIEFLLEKSNINMNDNMEVLLEINDNSDPCGYYVVDHRCHMMFWLEEISTDDLDIRESVSTSHFRLALEANYWTHVEHFPMHLVGLSSRCLDDLVSILFHGRADRMTSDTSTFPYTAIQCAEFLDLLSVARTKINEHGLVTDGSVIAFVGRLRGILVNSRFENHYGQESARLSSDQTLLGPPVAEDHWFFKSTSRLFFAAPEAYRARFENLWIDEIVHVDVWRRFMSNCLPEWKDTVSWGIALLIAQVLLLSSPLGSSWTLFSALLCGCGVLLGATLLHEMQAFAEASAADAAIYLQRFNHPRFGFRPVSLLYSLPRGLLQWSLSAFICELLVSLVRTCTFTAPVSICLVVLLAVFGLLGFTLSLLLREQHESSTLIGFWRSGFRPASPPELV